MKNVVVIGGGNGSAVSINALKTLKDHVNISAVISMSDSGGSSGRLRKEFGVLPTGDIMRAIVALSAHDAGLLKRIFYRNRFHEAGPLDGHNLGNLFLVLAERYAGDFLLGVEALHQAVDAVGRAYPVTLEQSDLCVSLSDGETIRGEEAIDRPAGDRSRAIQRAWLDPSPQLYSPAGDAVRQADYVLFGPGSLYTSIVATLLPGGMREALAGSNAQLVYIAGNAYERQGETGPTTLSGFIRELETYLPRPLDVIVYNNHILTESSKRTYEEKQWELFACDREAVPNRRIVEGDYEKIGGGLDPDRLGSILRDIIL